ncbi:hypothetical protein BTO08_18795 [Photobacterium angustum]|uniref:Carboxypeptidase regulatory-like domain-containing protein n=1 Tax=Photobacterium angustum TaxID=661 RepID=A0A2S7VJN6_PHOAN|nr:hypothetical protein BTO08_18795 [Photobacterium angustum]
MTLGLSLFNSDTQMNIVTGFRAILRPNLAVNIAWLTQQRKLSAEVDFNLSANHYLKLNYNQHDLLSNRPNKTFNQLEYRYFNRYLSLNLQSKQTKKKLHTDVQLRTQITSSLSTYFNVSDKRKKDENSQEYEFKTIYNRSFYEALTVMLRQKHNTTHLDYYASYRYFCDNCFFPSFLITEQTQYKFKVRYDKKLSAAALMSVELNPNIKLTAEVSDNSFSLSSKIQYSFKAYKEQRWYAKSISPNDYGYAAIKGVVIDSNGKPIPDIGLSVYRHKTQSDENGHFTIEGVSVNDNIPLHIDPTTLDVSYQPQFNPLLMNTEEGGITFVTVHLDQIVGIDGYIVNFNGDPNASITFLNNRNQVARSYKIEGDGFFIIEDLTPAEYTVTYKTNTQQISTPWIIENNQTWISNIEIDVGCIDKKELCELDIN